MIAYSDLLRVSLRQVTRQKSYGVVFSIALGIQFHHGLTFQI